MADNTLEIKVLAKNLAKEALAEAKKELEALGNATKDAAKKSEDAKSGMDKLASAFKAVAASAVVKQIAQTALELGKLGIQAEAVEQRFQAFAGGGRNSAEVLREVKDATDGTIDSMSAMQSATKLMQMGLATNAEEVGRLVEMAARLGDQTVSTSERVNDFALMLANQSLPRLDNYGISSGRVRQRIEELMVATQGMTREQAFLQATLEEGAKALEIMGNAGQGQVQSIERLNAAWSDLKVTIGKGVAPVLAQAADGLTGLLTYQSKMKQVFSDFNQQAVATGMSWTEYSKRIATATIASGGLNKAKDELWRQLQRERLSTQEITAIMSDNGRVVEELIKRNIRLGESYTQIEYEAIIAGTKAATQGYSDVGMGAMLAAEKVEQANDAIVTNFGSIEFFAEASEAAYSDLQQVVAGPLRKEMEDFTSKQDDATAKVEELSGKVSELEKKRYLTGEQKEELAALREELAEAKVAVEENAAKHEEATRRIIFGFMEQRLAMDGLTQAELMALQEVAFNWGLVDTATYTAMMSIDNVASSFETGKIKAEDLGKALLFATDAMVNMPSEHTFTFNWNQTGTPPPNVLLEPSPGFDIPNMYASGGVQQQSGWAMVGEQGPELTWLPRGTQVFSAPETERMLQNGAVGGTVNAPVTVYANVAGGVDIDLLARRVSEEIGRRVANRRVS